MENEPDNVKLAEVLPEAFPFPIGVAVPDVDWKLILPDEFLFFSNVIGACATNREITTR